MTPIDILTKQLEDVRTKRQEKSIEIETQLSEEAMNIFTYIGFDPKRIDVDMDSIRVHIPEMSHWDAILIKRERTYNDGALKFGGPKLSYRGDGDIKTEADLKYIVAIGQLAGHFLNKTKEWNELYQLMVRKEMFHQTDEYKTLRDQEWGIEQAIRDLETKEKDSKFNNIFNKGKVKLKKRYSFEYGSGRHDHVSSDEWRWEENKGGKTYTLFYIDSYRTNPWFDEKGKELDPVFERTERKIHKRVRKGDLESFVKYNLTNVE